MKVLVMVVPSSQAGDWPLQLLGKLGTPNTSDPKRWLVDAGEDWIAVSIADDVRHDYDPDRLAAVVEGLVDPKFYLIESHLVDLMTKYVQLLPENVDLKIDNDHGWIASAKEFKEAIAMHANWLYAEVSPLPESHSTANQRVCAEVGVASN